MSSNPPTRRSRRTPNGEPSLPIIPILIGVIVLGFVIGAGLSLAGRHDLTVVALASPSAAASETLAPVTPAPSEKPTPEPTAAPVQSADVPVVATTPRPPVRHATPRAATVRATPVQSPAAVVVATAAPHVVRATAVATQAAVARAAVTSDPNAANNASSGSSTATGGSSTASGAGTATVASDASAGVQADTAFAKLSAAVVRQYLEAVKRGDQDGAYAALGSTPGAKGVTLTEQGVVDSQTRVGRIDAHAAANDNALVSVQLQTANGPYYGQYTVHKTETGAAVIVSHSIVKP